MTEPTKGSEPVVPDGAKPAEPPKPKRKAPPRDPVTGQFKPKAAKPKAAPAAATAPEKAAPRPSKAKPTAAPKATERPSKPVERPTKAKARPVDGGGTAGDVAVVVAGLALIAIGAVVVYRIWKRRRGAA